jgi:hypothetical protein
MRITKSQATKMLSEINLLETVAKGASRAAAAKDLASRAAVLRETLAQDGWKIVIRQCEGFEVHNVSR